VNHADHVGLLRGGLVGVAPGERWADIGAGSGAFTLALADLLGPGASIVAVDRDAGALRANARAMAERFPEVAFETRVADFLAPLELASLDGIVAANSLHFVPREQKVQTVMRLAATLRPGGRLLVVEYDADRGNPWVPHPFSVASWQRMAAEAGLQGTVEIGRVPSRFLGAIYAAGSRA
jgi:ubiquinone/menaquinone biosynthesis C-methylase UbiE